VDRNYPGEKGARERGGVEKEALQARKESVQE